MPNQVLLQGFVAGRYTRRDGMRTEPLPGSDLHVHTNLSWCAGQDMSPDAIAEEARRSGLHTVGLADHLWLDRKRGCRPAVAHLGRRRRELTATGPVRILFGAEADCAPRRGLAGGAETRELDFVIAAYHFTDVREGLTSWPRTPEELARIMLEGFRSATEAPAATVIGHPFYLPPAVFRRLPPDLQDALPDAVALVVRGAGDLLGVAARRGLALELNFKALGPVHRALLAPLFRRAAEAGLTFTVSSDAHRLADLGRTRLLKEYLGEIGVDQNSIEKARSRVLS